MLANGIWEEGKYWILSDSAAKKFFAKLCCHHHPATNIFKPLWWSWCVPSLAQAILSCKFWERLLGDKLLCWCSYICSRMWSSPWPSLLHYIHPTSRSTPVVKVISFSLQETLIFCCLKMLTNFLPVLHFIKQNALFICQYHQWIP